MAQIFISYSNEDIAHAKALAEIFQDRGWSVWWDRKIPIGVTFDEVIERELKAADCVIALWTKTSVTSTWVKVEADEARKRGVLIPVLIEDVEAPLGFRYLQFADLTAWDGRMVSAEFEELISAVASHVGAPALPPRTSPPPDRQALGRSAAVARREPATQEAGHFPNLGLRQIASLMLRMGLVWVALWVGISLVYLVALQILSSRQEASEPELPYSQFSEDLDRGDIAAVAFEGPLLRGRFVNGDRFRTYFPDDPDLMRRLREKRVQVQIHDAPKDGS